MVETTSPFVTGSPQAEQIAHLFTFVLIISAFIFAVVTGLVVYIVIRYRHRGDGREASQVTGNRKLEFVWTLIPALILIAIAYYSFRTMQTVDPPHGNRKPDLIVTAHQWWWSFEYPNTGVTTAAELHMPVGEDWLIEVKSADVVHDFWVPNLNRKIDAIPNHPNYVWMKVTRPGTYSGTCAEYCGVDHALMRFQVIAEPEADYQRWLSEQEQPHPQPQNGLERRGAQLFSQRTCASCHTIRGSGADGDVGPDLTHLATRNTLASAIVANNDSTLTKWLKDPNSIKPGSHMPNMQLSDRDVQALVAYLEETK